MITATVSFLLGLVTGLLVMRKHKAKADAIEAKGRSLLDILKGR
jgi:hypothetical protein